MVVSQVDSRAGWGLGIVIPPLANITLLGGDVLVGFGPRQTMLAGRKTLEHCGCLQEGAALNFT